MDSIMNINQIMDIIPHRYPFLLIDKIVEMEEGKKVVALKNVTMNEPFFVGHYPNFPVMPGVLILEAMAQSGAVAILSMEEFKGRTPMFGAIDKAKFRGQVRPGDSLLIEVEILKLRNNAGKGMGIATVDGKKVAEAELTFMIL